MDRARLLCARPCDSRSRAAKGRALPTGPKARVNRRLKAMVYESSGASRAMERRENPP